MISSMSEPTFPQPPYLQHMGLLEPECLSPTSRRPRLRPRRIPRLVKVSELHFLIQATRSARVHFAVVLRCAEKY